MNGVTLDNWKVFYVDGDYTTLIYGDYLPNAAIDTTSSAFSNLGKDIAYGIVSNDNRLQLLEAMQIKSNWNSLLTGTINGHTVNEMQTTNVWAMGSPTIDLWVNSWNDQYPSDTLYTALTASVMGDGLYGYYIGFTENPTTYMANNMSSKEGYDNTLYYPHKSDINLCYGYWLASPSAFGSSFITYIDCMGSVTREGYDGDYAFRPVISLPTSVVNQ